MPLIRRLPKRGFNNTRFKEVVGIVNLDDLERSFEDGAVINEMVLRERGLVHGRFGVLKLLGRGEVIKRFTIEVDRVSNSAKKKIENAGGSLVLRAVPKTPAIPKNPKG